jgi:hypothetical protein
MSTLHPHIDREIRKCFGVTPRSRRDIIARLSMEGLRSADLVAASYDGLHSKRIYFGEEQHARWLSRTTMVLPEMCSACGEAATIRLPRYHAPPGLLGGARALSINDVPFCERDSGARQGLLAFEIHSDKHHRTLGVLLVAENELFLAIVTNQNSGGPIPPPWVAFPSYSPVTSGWRQSVGETWITEAWWPYWRRLGREAQDEIIACRDTPQEWADYLRAIQRDEAHTTPYRRPG